MHPMINIAVKAARRAASVITRASFEVEQLRVTNKGHNDFVTEVDQAAEQAIVDVLRQAYPDHASSPFAPLPARTCFESSAMTLQAIRSDAPTFHASNAVRM